MQLTSAGKETILSEYPTACNTLSSMENMRSRAEKQFPSRQSFCLIGNRRARPTKCTPVREVVITSVLDEDPPCVGVGGLCKIPLV